MPNLKLPERLRKVIGEISYCKTKIERAKRTQKQKDFLTGFILAVDWQIQDMEKPSDPRELPCRLRAAGLLEMFREAREVFNRELGKTSRKLQEYAGFEIKLKTLETERQKLFRNLPAAQVRKARKNISTNGKIENQLNLLSLDCADLDEGMFFIQRVKDYLTSCRSFCNAAWDDLKMGALARDDLNGFFLLPNIKRAKEMAYGAERNLIIAKKELVGVEGIEGILEKFPQALIPVLEALFEDAKTLEKFENTLRVMNGLVDAVTGLIRQMETKIEACKSKLKKIEMSRVQLLS